jgi:hypothetical protein
VRGSRGRNVGGCCEHKESASRNTQQHDEKNAERNEMFCVIAATAASTLLV